MILPKRRHTRYRLGINYQLSYYYFRLKLESVNLTCNAYLRSVTQNEIPFSTEATKKKTDGIVHQISCYYFFFSNKRERTLIGESVHTLLDFTREKKREKNKEEKLSKLMFHSPSSAPQKKKKKIRKSDAHHVSLFYAT